MADETAREEKKADTKKYIYLETDGDKVTLKTNNLNKLEMREMLRLALENLSR